MREFIQTQDEKKFESWKLKPSTKGIYTYSKIYTKYM